ncbi:MAG: patatin-like phospholipase family protein [Ferruginibacter sp.]
MEAIKKPVDVQAFINESGASTVLTQLKADINAREIASGKKFLVSDVFDAEGNQYVDMVQEGGGVWGIALLGYTYILEKMGIRFFSLAGTSAGAINTMLLAATGQKEEAKTERIIKDLLELPMFSFVDGKESNWYFTKSIKSAIQHFVLKANYVKKITTSIAWVLGLMAFFSIASFVMSLIFWNGWVQAVAGIALLCWLLLIGLIFFIKHRFKTLARAGYGLNEGKVFHEWITKILQNNDIQTLTDLKDHYSKTPATLQVRRDLVRDATVTEGAVIPPGNPMLTIITSEITTGNKIEFPRMWDMYWDSTNQVNPADFVRASMSIPVFFETFKIPVSRSISNCDKIWKDHINWNGKIPGFAEFVDGGALSNFPINVFYNPKYIIPRMPTFGIRLGGTNIQSAKNIKSVGEFFSALISTIRSNTDKDFMNRNKSFDLGIEVVDMDKHSWLNFFMEEKEKQEVFMQGAFAAARFLRRFDWENYKKERLKNNAVLEEQRMNPNNW